MPLLYLSLLCFFTKEANFSLGKCANIWLNRLTFITEVVCFFLPIKTYRFFSVNNLLLFLFHQIILDGYGPNYTIIILNETN